MKYHYSFFVSFLAVCSCFGGTARGQTPAPLAYWSFDNEADATRQVNDLSGNNFSGFRFGTAGTPTGGLPSFDPSVPTGLMGRSIYFDDTGNPSPGSGNQHRVALDMSFDGIAALPQLTVAGWVNTTAPGSTSGSPPFTDNWSIIDFDRSEYFNLYVQPDGRLGFSTNHGGAAANVDDMYSADSTLNNGTWRHVAVVYDGTDKHIYIDGALDSTASNPHGGNPLGSTEIRYGLLGSNSEAIAFNDNNGTTGPFHDGNVDDLAVWNTALSASEIADLASGSASPADSIASPARLAPGDYMVDFESFAGLSEGTPFADHAIGMHFEGAAVVLEGGAMPYGFTGPLGDDTPNAGESAGGVMLSDIADVNASSPNGDTPYNPIVVTWNGAAVNDLTFEVIDIDNAHEFRGMVFGDLEGNDLLGSLVIDAMDADTGDGVATLIDFSAYSGVMRLEFEVENVGTGNSGFGVDNFSFTVTPEPASVLLWTVAALAALISVRLVRRSSRV